MATARATDTVIDVKQRFLRSQVRILNQGLEPPSGWRDRVDWEDEEDDDEEEDGRRGRGRRREIGDKVVREVVMKLNAIVRRHNRAAYSSEALRHVAEQIDALYWAAGAPEDEMDGRESGLRRDADLRKNEVIAALPPEWPQDEEGDGEDIERYQELQTRLTELAARRQEMQQKLARYKQLQQLLEPFENPQENIQPNLVTRDGELQQELTKMRILMAKVAEGIGGLKESTKGREDVFVELESEEGKLAVLLGGR
ncbi:MAG: hypothetical protein M1819_005664 [Sarea resinae]|nr:MAG: hypothetical protein M1819_005664 [Sarea resinae]